MYDDRVCLYIRNRTVHKRRRGWIKTVQLNLAKREFPFTPIFTKYSLVYCGTPGFFFWLFKLHAVSLESIASAADANLRFCQNNTNMANTVELVCEMEANWDKF